MSGVNILSGVFLNNFWNGLEAKSENVRLLKRKVRSMLFFVFFLTNQL